LQVNTLSAAEMLHNGRFNRGGGGHPLSASEFFSGSRYSRIKRILFIMCICDKWQIHWYIVFCPQKF